MGNKSIQRKLFLPLTPVILVAMISTTTLAQVPSVGPSHCVWGCGAGGAAPSYGAGGGMNMGGLFGGLALSIGTALLMDALTQPTSPSARQPTGPGPMEDPQAEARRKALQEQQRLLDERHQNLISNLQDLPSRGLIDDPRGLSLLEGSPEETAAGAGRPFDGAAADAFWMDNHDVWFSTRNYLAQAPNPQPLPAGDQAVEYGRQQLKSLECLGPTPYGGEVCPFPEMRVSATRIDALEVSSPSEAPAPFQKIISQFSEYKGKMLSSFRRSWSNTPTGDPGIPDIITTNPLDPLAEKSLSGIQGETAKAGRGMIQNIMMNTARHFFSQLNQSLVNPDQAIKMGESGTLKKLVQDSAGESLPGSGKVAYLALTGRSREAFEEFKKQTRDKVEDKTRDFYKDKLTDFIGRGDQALPPWKKSTVVPFDKLENPHPDAIRWNNHKHWLTQTGGGR